MAVTYSGTKLPRLFGDARSKRLYAERASDSAPEGFILVVIDTKDTSNSALQTVPRALIPGRWKRFITYGTKGKMSNQATG